MGTPNEGRGILKGPMNKYLRWISYFLSAIIIPTIIELSVGWFFDEVLGLRLWSYEGNWMNFRGYISPSMSLFWEIMITFIMWIIFPRLKKIFLKINESLAKKISIVLIGITVIDFIINLVITINNL